MLSLITVTKNRRQYLANQIKNGIVFLVACPKVVQTKDVFYSPYIPNYSHYYLSGCDEPNTALLMLVQDGIAIETVLFCREYDKTAMQWDGDYLTADNAFEKTGIMGVGINALADYLTRHIQSEKTVYCLPGDNQQWDHWIGDKFSQKRLNNRNQKIKLAEIVDVSIIIDSMRLIKDEYELNQIQKSCHIACQALEDVMINAKQMRMEYEAEALLSYHYQKNGGMHAFPAIVASGSNACCLHYTANNMAISPSHLVLIDTGCRVGHYCSDITRTFPINGVWTGAVRDVYELVLGTQKKAITAAQVGMEWESLNKLAIESLVDGLVQLKICTGSVDEIIEKKTYRKFYMHSIGHSLGLDVHDVGVCQQLSAGMVITIEPGLYIPDDDDVSKNFRGIGLRIEDDVLINKLDNTVLTSFLVKEIDDITQLMS